MSRSVKAHILLIAVTVVWGTTFVLIKDALTHISPLLFNAVRMTLAALTLLLIFRRDMARLTRESARAGVLVGIFLWLGYEFQTTGLKLTTPSKSAFLTGVSVVLVPVFLAIGWRRMVNRWTATGVAVAFLGLYLLTVPAVDGGGLNLASINRGDLLTLGCAVGFAFQIITMGRATARFPFQQIATVEAMVSAGLMFITVPVLEQSYVTWTPTVIWAILITGLLGTAVAFTVQAWAQQFTPPTHTALIFSLEPVFAWMTSYVVLGERLGFRATVGAVMILSGVLLSELKGSVAPPAGAEAEAAEMAD
ncbi:MAG: DMT family transporter [Terriglobales bacterium]